MLGVELRELLLWVVVLIEAEPMANHSVFLQCAWLDECVFVWVIIVVNQEVIDYVLEVVDFLWWETRKDSL